MSFSLAPTAVLPVDITASRPKRERICTEAAMKVTNTSNDVRKAMYHCNQCHKDITDVVRIKCAVCTDFDICVECFSVGAAVVPHKADHDYRVIDNLNFPLFSADWGADEEILLLEAIELFGLGNWTEVSEHVGTKSKANCRSHYFSTYINVPTAPLPDFTNCGRSLQPAAEAAVPDPPPAADVTADATAAAAANGIVVSQRTFPKAGEPGAPVAEPQAKVGGNSTDITGYHAKRNEFDPDYDNDAELPLAEMDFGPNDTPEEHALKSRMLMIYNERLSERARRKQFILERGLLNFKRLQTQERKRTKEEREIHARFAVFSRFHSAAEHEALVEGVVAEHRLRARIEELKDYRRAGIHTLAEAEVYENEKRRREAERTRLKSLGASAAGMVVGSGAKSTVRANRYLMRDGIGVGLSVPVYGATRELQKLHGGIGGVALDIRGLAGADALCQWEGELCVAVRLMPVHYLSLKEALMRRCLKEGHLSRADARAMFKVDANKIMRVYDLLLSVGWLREEPLASDSEQDPQAAATSQDDEGELPDGASGEEGIAKDNIVATIHETNEAHKGAESVEGSAAPTPGIGAEGSATGGGGEGEAKGGGENAERKAADEEEAEEGPAAKKAKKDPAEDAEMDEAGDSDGEGGGGLVPY